MARKANGTSDYIASAAFTGPTAYSWAIWYKNPSTPGLSSTQQFLTIYNSTSEDYSVAGNWDHTDSDFQGAAQHRPSGGGWFAAKFGALAADTWYLLGATHDGSDLRSYQDGELQNTTTCGAAGSYSVRPTLFSAYVGDSSFDDGTIYRFWLWDRVLTDDEWRDFYKGIIPRHRPMLDWLVDHKATIIDRSGNGRHGAITGTQVRSNPVIGREFDLWGLVPTIGGATDLVIQDATHSHTAENVTLTQQHQLTVQGSAHSHTADNVTLTQQHQLAVNDALHSHAADNIALTQLHILTVNDSTHAHTADNVVLTQLHILAIQEALHSHSADNVTLSTATVLSIQEALHTHAAESITLTQDHTLAIQDALHAHTGESIALTQQHTLIINDALHAMLSDNVTLTLPSSAVTPDERIYSVEAENRIFVIESENRVFVIAAENRTYPIQ